MITGRYVTAEEFSRGLGGPDSVFSVESDEDALQEALDRGEEVIDTWLRVRYHLPETVESTPLRFKQIVMSLVKYLGIRYSFPD